MAKREVYNSSTMGPIPLSFTGRHLLQSLREAFSDYLEQHQKPGGVTFASWENVSRARGRIAQYISDLEAKKGQQSSIEPLPAHWNDWNDYIAMLHSNGRPIRISARTMDEALDKAMLCLKDQGFDSVNRTSVLIRLERVASMPFPY